MRLGFLLFLLLPVAAQVYVTWHMWQLLPLPLWGRAVVAVAMTVAFCLFFLALMPQVDRLPMPVATAVYHIGTSWLIIMLYLLMLWLALDLLRWVHVVPASLLHDSWTGTCAVVGLMCVVFGYGYVHYINKVRATLTLTTTKPLERPLRIVMTSDWHLGYHNRRAELARWVDMINAEGPDLVLVAGDIIDRSVRPLDDDSMALEFRRLKAPVYACLGNHEYLSGKQQSLRFYNEASIHLLQDCGVEVDGVVIIGRDDRSKHNRLSVKELTERVDTTKYMILLDHQPYHLEEAEAAGIDFELAGHTHHGQVWPANWITDWIYECAFGEHQRGRTHYYVSSGLGIWGGKFRIGTRSEYVVAELTEAPR